jgi:general secretion pathway protein J
VSARRRRQRAQRGLTLLEVLIASAILIMVSTMIWASFDQTSRLRARIGYRQENDYLMRTALGRITRDLRGAYLSLHVNQTQTLLAATTQFIGRAGGSGGSQLDMATFTHRRLRRGSHEGDACEVGYRLADRRGNDGRGMDLLRREQARIDTDPQHGGVLDVLVPGVRRFELKFYDTTSQQWVDQWDTTQAAGQPGRLPGRVRVLLSIEEGERREERVYQTETPLVMTRVLTFGLPIY